MLVWIRGVRTARPPIVVFKNVLGFPLSLLDSLLGDIYCISAAALDPADWGWWTHRRRRYCVMTLRRICKLKGSLGDMLKMLKGLFSPPRSV